MLVISTSAAADTAAAHRVAFQAAAGAGVQHMVWISVSNPVDANPFPAATIHARSEQDLRATGVAWTILRNALYAKLRVRIAAKYVHDGRWMTDMGDGSHASVARTGCAAAAAAALTDSAPAGRVYDVTGPELVDAQQYVALLEEFGGRRVVRDDVDDAEYQRYRAAFSADPDNAPYFELFTGTARRSGLATSASSATAYNSSPAGRRFPCDKSFSGISPETSGEVNRRRRTGM